MNLHPTISRLNSVPDRTHSSMVLCALIIATWISFAVFSPIAVYGQSGQINELRTWHDIRGNKLEARFVRFRSPTVYLRDNSRKTLQIHPSRLSKADQDYVIGLLRKQKKDELAATFAEIAAQVQGGPQPSNSGGSPSSNSGGTPPSSSDEPGNPPPTGEGTRPGYRSNPARSYGNPFLSPKGESPSLAGAGENGKAAGGAIAPPDSFNSNPRGISEPSDGRPRSKVENSNVDPFAELDPNWTPKSRVKNPNVDPFADLRPPEADRAQPNTGVRNRTEAFDSTVNRNNGYRPPVLQNKFDDTRNVAPEKTETESSSSSLSNQTILLIVLGVVGLLLLVMIALLAVVLVKSKNQQPRRSYF